MHPAICSFVSELFYERKAPFKARAFNAAVAWKHPF
jgi:hypothetical protein